MAASGIAAKIPTSHRQSRSGTDGGGRQLTFFYSIHFALRLQDDKVSSHGLDGVVKQVY